MDIEAPRHDRYHLGRLRVSFGAVPLLGYLRTPAAPATAPAPTPATPAPPPPDDSAAAFWEALEADDTGRLPVPKLFFAAYGAICAVSLGGGALLGARSFRGSVAEEALDRLNPSTAQSEALAARTAGRAFAYGTALAFGTGALAVLAAREILGLRSAMDVRESAHARAAAVGRVALAARRRLRGDEQECRRCHWLRCHRAGQGGARLDACVEAASTAERRRATATPNNLGFT